MEIAVALVGLILLNLCGAILMAILLRTAFWKKYLAVSAVAAVLSPLILIIGGTMSPP